MPGGIRRADIEDLEIVDAVELAATGLSDFATGIVVASTEAATQRVNFSGIDIIHDADYRLGVDDIVIITGSAAAGTYTVASVVDSDTVTVVEAIVDSTGGTAAFRYPPGASQVGFDSTGLMQTDASDVQEAIRDLDGAITGGGITEAQHRVLRQLIHFIDDGPGEGFASGAYKETTPTGPFPTSEIWWTSVAKTNKIVELTTTWTGVNPTLEVWKVYDESNNVLATVSDAISYTGIFETSRTRTITVP